MPAFWMRLQRGGLSPVARGRAASHSSISDARQATALGPILSGSGKNPARASR